MTFFRRCTFVIFFTSLRHHSDPTDDAKEVRWAEVRGRKDIRGGWLQSRLKNHKLFFSLQPQNVVLMGQFPNCEIKLCDLEVARVIKTDGDIREMIGTPDYVAPEILSMEPITLSADIWSLGVVAYVLVTGGFSPFGGDTDQETLRNITTAPLDFPPELFEGVSDMAKEFISLCLDRNPPQRPTVKECLAHVWIAQELIYAD
ncbi:MAG TPA: hypothetical protein EYQ00_14295 [Dehalococcoidia bacterium]|nr:hypothetical protein [Dehalococcoidia bacterium]